MIIIVKNQTVSDIILEDLGITIPGSSNIILTETFEFCEIIDSKDLKSYIDSDDIIINDGLVDLSKENSLKHVTYETAYQDKIILDKYIDLSESSTYSTSWIEKLKVDLDLESADYLLNWSFEIKSNDNTTSNFCEARMLINSNQISTNSWLYNKYQYFDGVDSGNISGNISISIEYRRQGNYQPVSIRNAKISLVKLN